MTGDSLFVGSVARPDLAVEAREGAEGLFHSLHRLLELPDDVRVFPGHVAGSLCGAGMSTDPRPRSAPSARGNALLAIATVQEFVDETAGISTPRPPNMERIVELNRGPFVAGQPPLEPAPAEGRHRPRRPAGRALRRRPRAAGALNVPVSGSGFGTKAGFVLRRDEPIVLQPSSPAEADARRRPPARRRLPRARRLPDEPEAIESLEPVAVDELERLLAADAVDVIDVREPDERERATSPAADTCRTACCGRAARRSPNGSRS